MDYYTCEYSGFGVTAVRWLGNRLSIIQNTRNITNIKPSNALHRGSVVEIGLNFLSCSQENHRWYTCMESWFTLRWKYGFLT